MPTLLIRNDVYKITASTYNNLDNCQRIIVVVNRH